MSYSEHFAPDADPENARAASGKRRRTALACTSCRRRKIRCDAGQPACGHCGKAGIDCVYDGSKRRRAPRTVVYGELSSPGGTLDNRLRNVESMLMAIVEKQGIHTKSTENEADDRSSDDSSLDSDSESEDESDDSGGKCDGKALDSKSDLFNLAERRSAAHSCDTESPELTSAHSMYSHGVTTAVLTPTCMRWLCTRVGNPELGKEAAELLMRLWRKKASCDMPVKDSPGQGLDVDITRYCVEQYRKCNSMPLKALLNNEDVDAAITFCNGNLEMDNLNEDSPYSLVFATIVMIITNDVKIHKCFGPYTAQQALEQNRLAFTLGTRIASKLFMSHSTVLLLRLLVTFVYMMSYRAMLTQLRSLGSLALHMACQIGLEREETSLHLPPDALRRRKILWHATRNIDVMLSLFLFQQPMVGPSESMALTRDEALDHAGFVGLRQFDRLYQIYMKAYHKVFSISARKTSVYRLLQYILKYDSKLTQWYEGLPPDMKDPVNAAEAIRKIYSSAMSEDGVKPEPYEVLDAVNIHVNVIITFISYYHVVILLHSIPALTPSSLEVYQRKAGSVPERLKNSLEIISHSARMLLVLLSHVKGTLTEATSMYLASNAFCVLFLKQIRQPRHPTNAGDVVRLYRFIDLFKKQNGSNSMVMSDISQNVLTAWLILANAITELNGKYQPSLPQSTQDEIRMAEEEALKGVESPFPSEMLHRQRRLQQRKHSKLPDPNHSQVRNGPPQLMKFVTSEVRPQQPPLASMQAVRAPQALQAAQAPPLVGQAHPAYLPHSSGPVLAPQAHYQPLGNQLHLPTPQSTPPQPLPPQVPPIVQPSSANLEQGDQSVLRQSSHAIPEESTLTAAALNGNAEALNGGAEVLNGEHANVSNGMGTHTNSPWTSVMQPGIFSPQGGTSYSSPADENSLWDAFSGVNIMQSNVYEQAWQPSSNPEVVAQSSSTDECIIA